MVRSLVHEGYVVVSKASTVRSTKRGASGPETVETFLASLDHPFKQEILAIRSIILGADPRIAEGINLNDIAARRSAFAIVVRQWISQV